MFHHLCATNQSYNKTNLKGLKGLRENRRFRIESARTAKKGTSVRGFRCLAGLAGAQDYVLGYSQPSLTGLFRASSLPRTSVLGCFQPSLQDIVLSVEFARRQ
jgi:hypothetical protein